MNFHAIRILSHTKESVIPAKKYSKFQLWICKTFNIIPEQKFFFTVKATVDSAGRLRNGDIIQAVDRTNWVTIKANDTNVVTFRSVQPYFNAYIDGLAVFIAMSFSETSFK